MPEVKFYQEMCEMHVKQMMREKKCKKDIDCFLFSWERDYSIMSGEGEVYRFWQWNKVAAKKKNVYSKYGIVLMITENVTNQQCYKPSPADLMMYVHK